MIATLAARFSAVKELRRDRKGMLVASGEYRQRPALLFHVPDQVGGSGELDGRVAIERMATLSNDLLAQPELLRHENGVTWVFDADEGRFLDEWVRVCAPVGVRDCLHLMRDLTGAIDALHQRRVLHLRLRPDCVRVIDSDGRPRARLLPVGALPQESAQALRHDPLTMDLRFSAPELSGRVAVVPDARTDLYLLGLLAYLMLTQRLPFEATDVLGWLHAHVAQDPVPLRALRPDLPEAVEQLVMSMLSKSPERRPVNAGLLLQDMDRCLQLLDRPTTDAQPLFLRSIGGRFQWPRRLIGREWEQHRLDEVIQRVRQGAVEWVEVLGPSGIGKTALLQDMRNRVTAAGGFFAAGKFDQLGGERPYAALGRVLDELVRQTGQAGGVQDSDWSRIGHASVAVLSMLSPELAGKLGHADPSVELSRTQTRERMLKAWLEMLRWAGMHSTAVVLFLDDIQWADSETLHLVSSVLADPDLKGVLCVTAQRTDDGSPNPVGLTDAEGGSPALRHTRLELRPLDVLGVKAWLAEALQGRLYGAEELAQRLMNHSGGNPFFLGQMVSTLVQQGRMTPDTEGGWRVEPGALQGLALPSTALEAAQRRMQRLQPDEMEWLAQAAMLGTRFSVTRLARVVDQPVILVQDALWRMQAAGLVEPLDAEGQWQFLHDRLQQVAYESFDAGQRLVWHLRMGRILRDGPDAAELVFEICQHLNQAQAELSAQEKVSLALLNQTAAAQSRARSALAQSAVFMREALRVLPPDAALTRTQHLGLLHDAAYAALLENDLPAAHRYLAQAMAWTDTPLAKARTDELRIQLMIAEDRVEDALGLAVRALRRAGLSISTRHTKARTLWQLVRLKVMLRGNSVGRLMGVPEGKDPMHQQVQRIIFLAVSVAYTSASPLYPLLGLLGLRQTLRHGLTPWCWQPIAVVGHLLAGALGEIEQAYELGEWSLRLVERFGTNSLSYTHLFYIMPWKVPLNRILPMLRRCHEQAERTGDFVIASYALSMIVALTWNATGSLHELARAIDQAREFSRRRNNDVTRDCAQTFNWVRQTLQGDPTDSAIEPFVRVRPDGRVLPHDHHFEWIHNQLAVKLNVIFGHIGDDVQALSQKVNRQLRSVLAGYTTPMALWFEAILVIDRRHAGTGKLGEWRVATGNLRKLRRWTGHCPENMVHRVAYLEAELAALAGEVETSRRLFDQAMSEALRNGFIEDAAIMAERVARWHRKAGRSEDERNLLRQAYQLYLRWGATAKLRQMMTAEPWLGTPQEGARDATARMPLDAQTLIKASQAISAELDPGRVAERLLQQCMESAGARYGALLLVEDGVWELAAQQEEGVSLDGKTIGEPEIRTLLPFELFRFVFNSLEYVTLDNACLPHVHGTCVRWQGCDQVSVLCVPMVMQGRPVGVLYLENDRISRGFTGERATLVGVLASQAAIALTNARLFDEIRLAREKLGESNRLLEQRVAERTQQLQDNYTRLARLERQHATDEERQRIMRDLHDGLGSQLFVTLTRVERGEIDQGRVVQALRECIADMRLALEAMGPEGDDFLDVWGNFHFRWENQLEASGVRGEWVSEVDAETVIMSPHLSVQLLRIVQEALTNVIKHAGASRVRVRLSVNQGTLEVEVVDGGRGMPGQSHGTGRGLTNMQTRAHRIGARLCIEDASPGTRVRVVLKLHAG